MLAPLVAEQLVPPVEPLVAIPITAWIEALKSMHDRKMFLEMTCEVGVSAEGLVALRMRTEEARWRDPISTLVKKKKKTSPASGRHARRLVCMNLAIVRGVIRCLVRHRQGCAGEKGVCRTSVN